MRNLGIAAVVAGMLCAPSAAHAFCGFYINGAGGDMFNNATQVVLFRGGTRTVLSMQNNYQGPPTDFAMVVPVPVVLKETDVKTLPASVFAKVDTMGAPRLVEYWEMDPCSQEPDYEAIPSPPMLMESPETESKSDAASYGVKIEALVPACCCRRGRRIRGLVRPFARRPPALFLAGQQV